MRYFTKEWYKRCNQTSFHFNLLESEAATVFSDDYFEKLYSEKLSEQLSSWKEFNPDEFDEVIITQQFKEAFQYNLKHLQENLPAYILDEVVDIRVLTLNIATKEVIQLIYAFCKENEKIVNQVREKCFNEKDEIEDRIAYNMSFHDCKIIKFQQVDKRIYIEFDEKGCLPNLTKIEFINAVILEQDQAVERCWWIYREIYKMNNGYELHVLLQNPEMESVYLTIGFQDVVFN